VIKTIAGWGMILALIIALMMGLVATVAPAIETFLLFIVAIMGIIVGYMNVTQAETTKALWWSIGFGLIGLGFIGSIPYIGTLLEGFVKTIGLFFTTAAGTFLFVLGVKIFSKR